MSTGNCDDITYLSNNSHNGIARNFHYNDVTISATASQITSLTIYLLIRLFSSHQRKHQKLRVTGLCEGNLPLTGEFHAQRAGNAENVSIWWQPDAIIRIMFLNGFTKYQIINAITWWHHQMETFSALLAICAGNSPVPGEFPTQRPVTRSFDVLFDLCLNKRLSKQ